LLLSYNFYQPISLGLDLGWPISERSSLVPNIWIYGGLLEGGSVGLDNNDLKWIRVAHSTQEKASWAVF
jgi:hypothetical protein